MPNLNKKIILACFCAVIAFNVIYYFIARASSTGAVQFTTDTIISLSGINDGDLKIASSSECAEISISGAVLTITDIPDANNFILKTTHNNALKLTPSGGVLDLTLNSANISSGNIAQWTLNASSGTTVAHIVGVSQANTWHAIKADNALFNTFQSNSSGEVSFTYNGDWSEKVFTIEADSTAPTSFSLVSPVNNHSTSDSSPAFSWNASSDPDVSYYQLYIDSSLDTSNISGTSASPASALSCGNHTWHVKAVDNAGNTTDSSTFSISIICGSVPVWMLNPSSAPTDAEALAGKKAAEGEPSSVGATEENNEILIDQIKQKIFAYSQARLKSLFQEQDSAKELKQKLEEFYGAGNIPVHRKHWHTIVNSYVYGNYPIQAIIQAIKFGGKTVHPNIPFSAWQRAGDYLGFIDK